MEIKPSIKFLETRNEKPRVGIVELLPEPINKYRIWVEWGSHKLEETVELYGLLDDPKMAHARVLDKPKGWAEEDTGFQKDKACVEFKFLNASYYVQWNEKKEKFITLWED